MSQDTRSPTSAPPRPMLSVGFVLLPQFTLLPFAAFVDALRLAADEGDFSRQIHIRWSVMGPSLQPVVASCGIEITPSNRFEDPQQFDYIVVVGGLLHKGPAVDPATLDYLRGAAAKGVSLVGVCTGSFALIRAGLMDGRRCCVSWYHYHDLVDRFSNVVPVADRMFVVDRDRITCAGGTAAADLAAWMIERHCGHAWAQKSLRIMLIDHARSGSASQPQPPMAELVEDDRVRRAVLLIEQRLGDPISSDELAQQLNVSKRQLERSFRKELDMTPQQFSLQLRLRYSLWLLAHSRRSVTQIGEESGFADTAHFSRQFRALFGVPPSTVRSDPGLETALLQRVAKGLHQKSFAAPPAAADS